MQWDNVCKGLYAAAASYQDFLLPASSLFGEEYLPTVAVVAGKGSPSEDAFSKSTPWAKNKKAQKNFLNQSLKNHHKKRQPASFMAP